MKVALLRFNPDRILWGLIYDGMRKVFNGKEVPRLAQVPHFETPLNILLITSEYVNCGEVHCVYRNATQVVGMDLVLDELVICEVLQ